MERGARISTCVFFQVAQQLMTVDNHQLDCHLYYLSLTSSQSIFRTVWAFVCASEYVEKIFLRIFNEWNVRLRLFYFPLRITCGKIIVRIRMNWTKFKMNWTYVIFSVRRIFNFESIFTWSLSKQEHWIGETLFCFIFIYTLSPII